MKNKNIYPWVVVALLWVVALLNYMVSVVMEQLPLSSTVITKSIVNVCLEDSPFSFTPSP